MTVEFFELVCARSGTVSMPKRRILTKRRFLTFTNSLRDQTMNLLKNSFAALAILALIFTGCGDQSTDNKKNEDKKNVKEDDHSDHGHAHKHGPNHGSHFTFEGASDFSAEVVTYKQNDLVKVMFCDASGDKTVSLKADKVSITRTTGDDMTPFELEALEADADGKTDGFELENKDLRLAVEVGPVKVTATIDGKEYTGTAHPHNH